MDLGGANGNNISSRFGICDTNLWQNHCRTGRDRETMDYVVLPVGQPGMEIDVAPGLSK